jgi:hypothetical protein
MLCSHDMTITICRGVDSPSGNTYHGDISAKAPPPRMRRMKGNEMKWNEGHNVPCTLSVSKGFRMLFELCRLYEQEGGDERVNGTRKILPLELNAPLGACALS